MCSMLIVLCVSAFGMSAMVMACMGILSMSSMGIACWRSLVMGYSRSNMGSILCMCSSICFSCCSMCYFRVGFSCMSICRCSVMVGRIGMMAATVMAFFCS